MSRARRALAALLAVLAFPASAAAAGDLQTGIADDALILRGDPSVFTTAKVWAGLGIDSVRIHARWIAVVPRPEDRRKPRGFDSANPDDPGYNWRALDLAVLALRVNGIEPILAVTGSGPVWASADPRLDNPRYRPSARLFGQFASAVAQRYGQAVSRYLIWNEPNLPAWLQPQNVCARTCRPESPHLYRELFGQASTAIRRQDAGAQVMFGTLAPRGSDPLARNTRVRPLAFIRTMGCVTRSYRRDRTGPCRTARPVRADGFAYHPHPVQMAPDEHAPDPDDASLADLGRLEGVLDRTVRAGVVKPVRGARFPLHLTEFGYQTNPPDRRVGVSLAQQARFVQQGAYLAWKDPRVRTLTQYEFQDEATKTNSLGTDPFAAWQSGMVFADGRAKPLLRAFPNPFWVDVRPGRAAARFWGQVRPGGAHRVALQRRVGSRWTTLRELGTNAFGFWTTVLPVRAAGTFRFTWADGASLAQHVEPGS